MMKFPLSLQAIVTDGSPALSDYQRDRMQRFYAAREGKQVQVTLSDAGKPRSHNQNRYYWSVVVRMIADETGHDDEDMHEILKAKFLPAQFVTFQEETIQVRKSTTRLATHEFEEYLERIRAFAATELNMEIPMPNQL